MKKLKNILLIDDNEVTNFLHKKILQNLDCAENIAAFEDAETALDYVTCHGLFETQTECPKPELILLDINMPGMNGWEFLEKYNALPSEYKGTVILMLLSTTLNPADKERAKNVEGLKGFIPKPLSEDQVRQIFEKYF